jgi:hypothetical protein
MHITPFLAIVVSAAAFPAYFGRFTCARQETDGHASAPGIHLNFFAIYFLVQSQNRFRSFFASVCFHSLDSALVLPLTPPPDKHVTGTGLPMANRAPKLVVTPRYLEPFMQSLGYLYGPRIWQPLPLSVAAGDSSS